MLAQDHHWYTHSEYFALETQADYKNEYRQGVIVAMAGGSLNHNRIAGNMHTFLNNTLSDNPCEAFIGDVRLWVIKKDFYTYPDVMVVCGPPELIEGRTDTITNPKVIIEVLSESTAGYDRGDKFHAYWTLDSLAACVLIDQYRLQVEYFRQVSDKEWRLLILTKIDDVLTLESIEVEIPLGQIYRNVTWEA